MKTTFLLLTAMLVASFAVPIRAESQYFGWSVSASSTDPFVNNPPNPGAGVITLYLWMLDTRYPNGEFGDGWASAEYRISTTNWTMKSFETVGPLMFDVGTPVEASGKNFLMVIGACPTEAKVIGEIVVESDGSEGALVFGETLRPGAPFWAVAVQCSSVPQAWAWPEFVRFVGFASDDLGRNQDEGGLPATSVEVRTWGKIKALYR